jgi:hypothetical protein
MRINDLGNILIGSSTDNGNKLQVTGTARFDINGTNNRATFYVYSGNETRLEFIQNSAVTITFTSGGRFPIWDRDKCRI